MCWEDTNCYTSLLVWILVAFACHIAVHFHFCVFLVWAHFSFVFLSHLFPSANAQHPRVCGIQSIQPSGLQQLQAGREPGHQQPGHGRRINYYILRQRNWPEMALGLGSSESSLLPLLYKKKKKKPTKPASDSYSSPSPPSPSLWNLLQENGFLLSRENW